MSKIYYTYGEYLKEKYGEKVYKLPVKINTTCPNRDGRLGYGGCIFCGDEGGAFENRSVQESIATQLEENQRYITKRYKAKKFIAYFQNFTNTYMAYEDFKMVMEASLRKDLVGINISTRPDCVTEEQLSFIQEFGQKNSLDITLEFGLQSVNTHTLAQIGRRHGLAEYIDGVMRTRKYDIRVCSHVILNLPWDEDIDAVEAAKLLSILDTQEVKLHSLYILKNTILGEMYKDGEIKMIDVEEYKHRVILFLRHLDEKIVIQRLMGRAPKENTLFCNWGQSWWKIKDEIIDQLQTNGYSQGDLSFRRKPIVFFSKVK